MRSRLLLVALLGLLAPAARLAAQSPPAASPSPARSPAPPPIPPSGATTPSATTSSPSGAIGSTALSGPISVDNALQLALQQASAAQQASYDEQIAAEDLRQARAAFLPRLRSASTYTYNSPSDVIPPDGSRVQSFIGANAVHEYQELIGVVGDLDLSGALRATLRKNRALLDAAHAQTELARRALIRGVNEAYYGASLATAKRQAAEVSLAAAEEFERITTLNYQAGEVPEVDAIRARLQSAARRDELFQAQQNERVALAGLRLLLGYPRTGELQLQKIASPRTLADLPAAPPDPTRRPEYIQLEAQRRAANSERDIARAERLPRLTYSLDRGFDTDSLQRDAIREHSGYYAVANLDIPLFDWGIGRSKSRQAELRLRSFEAQAAIRRRELDQQFYTARDEVSTSWARVENARKALSDAEKNEAISVARYRAGEAPISEATDAQTTLANQRLALEQALYDLQLARVHLREVTGS